MMGGYSTATGCGRSYQSAESSVHPSRPNVLILSKQVRRVVLRLDPRQSWIVHAVNLTNSLRPAWRQVVHIRSSRPGTQRSASLRHPLLCPRASIGLMPLRSNNRAQSGPAQRVSCGGDRDACHSMRCCRRLRRLWNFSMTTAFCHHPTDQRSLPRAGNSCGSVRRSTRHSACRIITRPRCLYAGCSTMSRRCSGSRHSARLRTITLAAADRSRRQCTILKTPHEKLETPIYICRSARVRRCPRPNKSTAASSSTCSCRKS
jgi:hypothetical protein